MPDVVLGTDTNSETSSPVTRPADARPNESPKSSAPGTPVNENDYFTRPPRLGNPSTRSLPTTPSGSRGNISFSPRIQFYDAWSASDYDRRGDIATCNRLTPMLAQQIKEELNSFKMVCCRLSDTIAFANFVNRRWKFTSFLSLTPISSNDYASIIWTWRLGETFSFSTEELKQNSIYELTVLLTQFHFLVNDDLVSSVLASICTRIERAAWCFG